MLAAIEQPPVGNADAEAALCGALMCDNRQIDVVADRLAAEDFSEPLFGRIYAAILAERNHGREANVVTLRPYFTGDAAMAELGGPGFLAQLTGSGAALLAVRGMVDQIRALAQRRRLIDGLRSVLDQAHGYDASNEELLAEAETLLAEAQDRVGGREVMAGQALSALVERLGQQEEAGVSSGIAALDDVLGPIKPSQLVILAGRPGMGKTSTALSYALGAAQKGHGVLFVSLEMDEHELTARMAADLCFDGHTGIPFAAIESGRVSNDQARQIARAADALRDLPLQIMDLGAIKVGGISAAIRRHARRFEARGRKLELVIVDYLQLVRPDHRTNGRYEAITEVSIGLKAAAKTNRVGIMALAQLSRDVEKRGGDHKPKLADLRDSGQIEQDADGIMFLFRPEYYLAAEKPAETDPAFAEWQCAMDEVRFQLEFIVAKRRNRPAGVGRGYFYGAFQAVRG